MVRPRDSRGRFIGKFLVGIFGPKHIPHINTSDHYTGSTSRQGRAGSEGKSKGSSSPPTVEQRGRQYMSTDPVLNQEVDPKSIRQILSNQEEGMLEPVADSPAEEIPEVLGDNFTPNQIDNPSGSDWDTTPRASVIRIFRGMANEERRRRGLFGDNEPEGPRENDGNVNDDAKQEVTFGFPIFDSTVDVTMKNIPPSALPHFHSMSTEDPDSFLFEFDILCSSYNYVNDAQKLKLFPATLKDSALRWFMGLGEHTIRSWDEMKIAFLRKY